MVFDRLYTAITYALLQFSHKTLLRLLPSVMALIVLCVVASALFFLGVLVRSDADSVLPLLRQFVLLTLAQTAINLAAADLQVTPLSPVQMRTECVAATTILLLMVHACTQVVHDSRVLDRTVTLLLYMYTDALEAVLHSLALGAMSVLVAVLVYVIITASQQHMDKVPSLSIVSRGVSMVCINVLLRTISNESLDLHTKAGSLLFFLFLSDFALTLLPFLDEVRGYILWKTAQIIYEDVLTIVRDVYAGMLLGVIMCSLRYTLPPEAWPQGLSTIMQLSALVVVNMVLGPLSTLLGQMQSVENVIVAFNIVVVVHMWVYGLFVKREGQPN